MQTTDGRSFAEKYGWNGDDEDDDDDDDDDDDNDDSDAADDDDDDDDDDDGGNGNDFSKQRQVFWQLKRTQHMCLAETFSQGRLSPPGG